MTKASESTVRRGLGITILGDHLEIRMKVDRVRAEAQAVEAVDTLLSLLEGLAEPAPSRRRCSGYF
jgi:hypothetical protein